MYKKASRLKLRFSTPKGNLSAEQLWDLSQTDLSNSVKSVKKILKKSDDDELSFLEEATVVDTDNQLRFDILKDVYLTKKAEFITLREAAEIKAHNQKIFTLIAEKQDDALKGKTIEQLEAMIK